MDDPDPLKTTAIHYEQILVANHERCKTNKGDIAFWGETGNETKYGCWKIRQRARGRDDQWDISWEKVTTAAGE